MNLVFSRLQVTGGAFKLVRWEDKASLVVSGDSLETNIAGGRRDISRVGCWSAECVNFGETTVIDPGSEVPQEG